MTLPRNGRSLRDCRLSSPSGRATRTRISPRTGKTSKSRGEFGLAHVDDIAAEYALKLNTGTCGREGLLDREYRLFSG